MQCPLPSTAGVGSDLKTIDMVAPVAHKLVNPYSIMMTVAPRLCQWRTTREIPRRRQPKTPGVVSESSRTQIHQRGLGPRLRLVDPKTQTSQKHHRHRDKQPPLMTTHDIYVSRVLPFQYRRPSLHRSVYRSFETWSDGREGTLSSLQLQASPV